MLILNSSRFESVFSERSFATYLAGSQYITWESLYEERTSIVGYARAVTLSYGLYCFMYRYSSGFFGLPHSSNSMTVRGRDSSNMVLITSTKGTYVTTAWNRSGRRLVTAPIQQPAGAATHDRQAILRGVAQGDQVLGGGDEVREGVHLVHHAALVVPLLAQLAAAVDVGHRIADATIDQRKHVGVEPVGNINAIGAVAVEEQRALAVARRALLVEHRDGHPRAVGGRRPDALHLV